MTLSLLCRVQQDREHAPCSGTTDDGTDAPCTCSCHVPRTLRCPEHGHEVTPFTACPVCVERRSAQDLLHRMGDLLDAIEGRHAEPRWPIGKVVFEEAPPLRPDAIALTWRAPGGVLCALAWHPRRGLNGYVYAPNNAPIDWDVSVHGGITWARDGWIGFDTGHIGDWWPEFAPDDVVDRIGGHLERWTKVRVINETEYLAVQVKAASEA